MANTLNYVYDVTMHQQK